MGIYYTKLFFEIYYTITKPESTRGERSLDQFKIQLIAQLRNIGHKISVIDETSHIYQLNGKFILFFPHLLKTHLNQTNFCSVFC